MIEKESAAVPDVKEEEKNVCPDCHTPFTGDSLVDHELHGRCSSQGEKEAVADSVEAQGQNELLPCPFCGETDIRSELTSHFGKIYCSECGAEVHAAYPRTVEEAKLRWNKRAAISVSDGGGSDASGVSLAEEAKYPGSSRRADSSSLANAQAPMERWEVRDSGGIGVRDVFCGRLLICNEVEPAKAQAFCDAHNASLPSVIKEQPADKDLEGKEEERVGSIYSASEVLPSLDLPPLDLEEKEAVTRNTAVLELLRLAEIELTLLGDAYRLTCQLAKRPTQYRDGSRSELIGAIQRLLSEADGQPESASGVSSKELCSPPDGTLRVCERGVIGCSVKHGEQKENP